MDGEASVSADGTNSLVAERQDTTSTLSGAGLLDDIEQLSSAITNKSWVSGALAGVAMGVDTIAYVSDPLGTLMAWGIGWVFDHIQPFKDWMLQLAGDSDQLRANGQTWKNISATLRAAAHNIEQDVRASFPDGSFTGSTASAYVTASSATTAGIAMAGTLSGAVGTAYDVCAVIIQFVHDFVRDAISQVVGSILSYAVELVASFGTAFPLAHGADFHQGRLPDGRRLQAHHRPEGIPVEPGRSADQRRPAAQVAQRMAPQPHPR